MNAATRFVIALSLSVGFVTVTAGAASWQEQLSAAASALGQQQSAQDPNTRNTNAQADTSLSALSGLLNGGTQLLSANTMTNAAGVLQYCVKNNLIDNNVSSMKEQLLEKLGLQDPKQQTIDYQQGLIGLLNTGSSQQVNLQALGETPLGKKVKTQACDLVLKQGWNFIS